MHRSAKTFNNHTLQTYWKKNPTEIAFPTASDFTLKKSRSLHFHTSYNKGRILRSCISRNSVDPQSRQVRKTDICIRNDASRSASLNRMLRPNTLVPRKREQIQSNGRENPQKQLLVSDLRSGVVAFMSTPEVDDSLFCCLSIGVGFRCGWSIMTGLKTGFRLKLS